MQPPPHNPYDLLHRIFSQPRGWRGQGGHESVRSRIEGQKWVSLGHQRQLRTKRWKDAEEGKDPDTNAERHGRERQGHRLQTLGDRGKHGAEP